MLSMRVVRVVDPRRDALDSAVDCQHILADAAHIIRDLLCRNADVGCLRRAIQNMIRHLLELGRADCLVAHRENLVAVELVVFKPATFRGRRRVPHCEMPFSSN